MFLLYFFCGYMIYSGIFLAIGSLCDTVKEAQNFMGTAMIVMMVPLFTMFFIVQDPHGSLATFLSAFERLTPSRTTISTTGRLPCLVLLLGNAPSASGTYILRHRYHPLLLVSYHSPLRNNPQNTFMLHLIVGDRDVCYKGLR